MILQSKPRPLQATPIVIPPTSYEYISLPLSIVPTMHGTISPMILSGLIHLLNILLAEEKQAYDNNQK